MSIGLYLFKFILPILFGILTLLAYYCVGNLLIEDFGYTWKYILKETFIILGIAAFFGLLIIIPYFIFF